MAHSESMDSKDVFLFVFCDILDNISIHIIRKKLLQYYHRLYILHTTKRSCLIHGYGLFELKSFCFRDHEVRPNNSDSPDIPSCQIIHTFIFFPRREKETRARGSDV